jgi:hypothetical protein
MPTPDSINPPSYLRAIVDAIVPMEGCGLSTKERNVVVDDSTRYVAGQIAAMSRDLRLKAWAGMAGFRAHALVRMGRPFGALPATQRQRLVDQWSYGSLYLPRQLFRMLRSLALLGWFEHPLVLRALPCAIPDMPAGDDPVTGGQRVAPPGRVRS